MGCAGCPAGPHEAVGAEYVRVALPMLVQDCEQDEHWDRLGSVPVDGRSIVLMNIKATSSGRGCTMPPAPAPIPVMPAMAHVHEAVQQVHIALHGQAAPSSSSARSPPRTPSFGTSSF